MPPNQRFLHKNSLHRSSVIPKKRGLNDTQKKGLEESIGDCRYEPPPFGGLKYMLFRYSEGLSGAVALR